jgi:hypothetical protein
MGGGRMNKLLQWFYNRRAKRFGDALSAELNKANVIHKAKGETVICSYCGQLLKKSEACAIYDIDEKTLTYHHDKCFYANEHVSDKMPEVDNG